MIAVSVIHERFIDSLLGQLNVSCLLHVGCKLSFYNYNIPFPAPEVIGNGYYGLSADWWGFGCLLYEMTAGAQPFRARGERPHVSETERRVQTQQEEYGDAFSPDARDLCSSVSPHTTGLCNLFGKIVDT